MSNSVEKSAAPARDKQDIVGKRIEEMRRARKERGDVDQSGLNMKLSIPEVMKDKRLVYRWVNDRTTRLYEMKQRGWQVVDDAALAQDARNTGVGTVSQRVANERTTPKVEHCVLMWKPREFYEEDKAKEQAKIKRDEDGLRRGEVRDPQGLSGPHAYVPAGGISIKHGQ